MKKKIIIVGAGGHAESCIDLVENNKIFSIKCLVGLKNERNKILLKKYKVTHSDNDLKSLSKKIPYALIGIGQIKSSSLRVKLFKKLKKLGFKLPTIISPNSVVSKHSSIGEGTVVMPGAIIGPNVIIGKNCIINSKALIEHGTIIKDNCHVATAAIINSGVRVGAQSFIGSNSTIKQSVKLKSFSFVKMNARIIHNG